MPISVRAKVAIPIKNAAEPLTNFPSLVVSSASYPLGEIRPLPKSN